MVEPIDSDARRDRSIALAIMASLLALSVAVAIVAARRDGSIAGGGAAIDGCGRQVLTVGERGPATSPSVPVDDDALAQATAATFCKTFVVVLPSGEEHTVKPSVTGAGAECIGRGLVRSLGAARVRQFRFGSGPWSLLGFGLTNHSQIDRAEAEKIVDAFKGCTADWKLLMITSITQGADEISLASARCTASRLADGTARAIFAGEIDRAYDEGPGAQPFGDAVRPLISAMRTCLTADELDRLDWN